MKKCYYIVATHQNKHYYIEGEFTQSEIDQYVNNFDINKFVAEADEEYCGPAEGTYEIYRQSSLTVDQLVDIGVATKVDNGDDTCTVTHNYPGGDAARQLEQQLIAQNNAEILAEFGDVELPVLCSKQFA